MKVLEPLSENKVKESVGKEDWAVFVIFDKPKDSANFSLCGYADALSLIFALDPWKIADIFHRAHQTGYPQSLGECATESEANKKMTDAILANSKYPCYCFSVGGGRFYVMELKK
jgi:hypothetical protein